MKKIWGVVVGALLLACGAGYAATNEKSSAKIEVTGTVDVNDVSPGSALDVACASGEEHRTSDLCAQWKAADAAEKAAYFSEYNVWITAFIAVLSVISTFGAAIAVFAVFRSERAWLTPKDNDIEFTNADPSEGRAFAFVGVHWHNTGRSPAIKATYTTDFIVHKKGQSIPKFPTSSLERHSSLKAILGPGDAEEAIVTWKDENDVVVVDGALVQTLILYASVEYSDIFIPFIRHKSEITRFLSCVQGKYFLVHRGEQNNIS